MSHLDQQAAMQSAFYWLLADLFLNCPDAALVERLRGDLDGVEEEGAVAVALKALAAALPGEDGIEALAVEYTRLFGAIRPDYGPPPPYESMHRKGAEDRHARDIEEFYITAGLATFEPATPPDHIGVELRFMALLCHEEAECLRSGDVRAVEQARATQAAFLDNHLLVWARDYLDMIRAQARMPFYRELATITSDWLVQRQASFSD
jgi:putative dimethyl sulfoxide reductase chaperone